MIADFVYILLLSIVITTVYFIVIDDLLDFRYSSRVKKENKMLWIDEYVLYESTATVKELTDSQQKRLISLGVNAMRDLGENGKRLHKELLEQIREKKYHKKNS